MAAVTVIKLMCFDALHGSISFLLTVPTLSLKETTIYSVTFLKSLGSPFLFEATVAELQTLLLNRVNPLRSRCNS